MPKNKSCFQVAFILLDGSDDSDWVSEIPEPAEEVVLNWTDPPRWRFEFKDVEWLVTDGDEPVGPSGMMVSWRFVEVASSSLRKFNTCFFNFGLSHSIP